MSEEPPTVDASPIVASHRGTTLHDDVRHRFGVLPNFFRLAPDTPEITANLWGFAKFAYLDNPLPSLFKERLFVYLSRFCAVRYCIARHVGFLIGLGRPSGDATAAPQSVDEVLELLRQPLPQGEELQRLIALCRTQNEPIGPWTQVGGPLEPAIIACASHVFLQTAHAPECLDALKRALGDSGWHYLSVFLAFVRTAHYWTKIHPELQFEDDLLRAFATHEELADRLLNDPEGVERDVSQRVIQELSSLRIERTQYEAERSRSIEVRRETEERLRAAFESSVVGFAILNLDTSFIQVNDAYCAITGFSSDELKTMACASLNYPDDRAAADALVSQLISGERSGFVLEKRYVRKDGTLVWVQNSMSATYDANGQPRHLVTVCQDVTERRRASQMKDDFLATLSHELRTPLSAVLGWAQLLRSGALPPDETEKALEAIERNARVQAKLVDELLDVSRIMSGKVTIAADAVDLARVVADAVEAVRPSATSKHLALHVAADSSIDYIVEGEAIRLEQIVWNLLSNAVKFTPPHGAIEVKLCRDGDTAVIQVRDTGQGIRAELLPFVFDRFQQGDSSTTRQHGGLGLGLAIARQLTKAHRGTVTAESQGEGCGTTFTVRLPLADPPADAVSRVTTPRRDHASVSLHGAHLLVVDDTSDARDLLRAALESAGARVTTASSTADVIALTDGEKFDLLLADIGMPDQDGYALIGAPKHPST